MVSGLPHRIRGNARFVAVALCGSAAAGIMTLACRDVTSPAGQRGPSEVEPRAGRYVVAEFVFTNTCADPDLALSDDAATTGSATFDVTPAGDDLGTVALNGTFRVANYTPGAEDVVIFEGPDTGQYWISGDTLRLLFPKEINQWVGVLRFSRYQAGQLAGSSRTRCRVLALRLEKRP